MFTDLMHRIDLEAVGTFFKLTIANPLVEVESKKPAVDDLEFIHGEVDNQSYKQTNESPKPQPIRAKPSIGRNEPCPCGSGKKYKKCCGLAKKIP